MLTMLEEVVLLAVDEKTGRLTTAFCSRTRAKCGVSSTDSRTYRPTAMRTTLTRNGMRQPQERKKSSPPIPETIRTMPVARQRTQFPMTWSFR